jgi:hypothetical protein
MKKIISLVLTLVFMMSMANSALADETNVGLGDYEIPVTATYVAGQTSGTVFSVDIAWEGLEFTYRGEPAPVWNPDTHSYSGSGTSAGWTGSGSVTVTNHSNAFLIMRADYSAAEGYSSVGMNFECDGTGNTANTNTIYSAEVDNKAQTSVITVTPTGTLPAGADDVTIGTIVLSISEMNDITRDDVLALFDALTINSDRLINAGCPDEEHESLVVTYQSLYKALSDAEEDGITTEEQVLVNKLYVDTQYVMNTLMAKYYYRHV